MNDDAILILTLSTREHTKYRNFYLWLVRHGVTPFTAYDQTVGAIKNVRAGKRVEDRYLMTGGKLTAK